MPETKVKICGLVRRQDALQAAEAGADYLGVVLVPGSPRFQTPEEARALLAGIQVPSAMVVANMDLPQILGAAKIVEPSVIQLHGDESPELISQLRVAGGWKVWKAVGVRDRADVMGALARYRDWVDGLLLDAWHPEKGGGTGASFSWKEVAGIRGAVPEELLLVVAGGLSPENVREAVTTLRPDVVDVSSGVETSPGVKDGSLVGEFLRNARAERAGKTQ